MAFRIGSEPVYTYSLYVAAGLVAAALWLAVEAQRRGWRAVEAFEILVWALLPGLACGRLAYVLATCCLGLLISTLMTTQAAAMIFSTIITQVTAVNFSGVVVPVASLSSGGQKIAHLIPCMYYTRIVEGSFLKGTGVAQLWSSVAVLFLFSAVFFGISYLRFHKRTET